MNTSSRVKKVYHLRKTVTNLKSKEKQEEQKNDKDQVSQFKVQNDDNNSQILQNLSIFKKNQRQANVEQNNILEQQTTRRSVEGPELSVNTLFLNFEQKLNCIQAQQIKVKNIGSSAVYYQWRFKNQSKINQNAIKDVKPKFFCHHSKQSIKPGEQITFIFSFVSEIPGFFTEQCEFLCQPSLLTPIPTIRLQGKAYIDDEWKQERAAFLRELQQSVRQCTVYQTVDDLIDQVKLPPPQKPNVKDPKIAEQLFQKVNQNRKLFFNPYIHTWFNQLYQEVFKKQYQQPEQQIYWDQSIQTFKNFISNCKNIDEVEKICFIQRLEHYTHLSTFPLPNKSQLYQTVYNFVSDAAYHLGGDYADTAKKQLDMWEVPFREPLNTDTQEDLKTRKQEVDKIKAEWLKRTKKKKWGEQQEKQMVQEFKNKVKAKTNQELLSRFQGFQSQAQYTKVEKVLQNDKFNPQSYFLFLERMKTVNEYSLEGKKVFLKFHLKLKENCQKELKQLQDYLIKKQEQKKKAQEQKKNTDAKKKKPAPKKKGQKQQQQQKPLSFDFSTLLDQQNWDGFLDTFRVVQQKSPYLIIIGCTYRERLGRIDEKMTVGFLLEHLKTVEPSIQFMAHSQLVNMRQNLQNQNISEGSIFLLQNLNFLPSQTLTCEQIELIEQEGVQKHKTTKRKVLYPEAKDNLNKWASNLDVIIDQDRFLPTTSGISSYAGVQVILGKTWWNYVSLSKRAINQNVILSGDFNPETLLLIQRLLKYSKTIYLLGSLGAKFRLASKGIKFLGNLSLNDKQISIIKGIIEGNPQEKLFVPSSLKYLSKSEQGKQKQCVTVNIQSQLNFDRNLDNYQFIDIADDLGNQIASSGHIFMVGKSHTVEYDQKLYGMNSTVKILKNVYKIQEQKRARHSIEVNTPSGIDYNNDLVLYLVGIDENYVQGIELKEKKVKIQQAQQGQQLQPEQNEEPQEQADNQKRKIDLVADFKLSSAQLLVNLLSGKFDYGLKNISRYPKPKKI